MACSPAGDCDGMWRGSRSRLESGEQAGDRKLRVGDAVESGCLDGDSLLCLVYGTFYFEPDNNRIIKR
jgi:hypothetical protein